MSSNQSKIEQLEDEIKQLIAQELTYRRYATEARLLGKEVEANRYIGLIEQVTDQMAIKQDELNDLGGSL